MPDLLLDPWVQIALGVSFILAIGQAFAFFCSKTPATAHAILVLALTGSLVFPLFHVTVGLADWGQLPDLALSPVRAHSNTDQDVTGQIIPPKENNPFSENLTPKSANNETGQFTLPHEPTANLPPPESTGILENLYTGVRKFLNSQGKSLNPGIFLFLTFFHWVLALLTAISFLLLARTFWANLRLVKTSKPVDEVSAQFLKGLAEKIGLSQVPRLREHSSVRTPAVLGIDRVWATILIPKGVTPQSYSNAIYFHELAHLKRYDSLCRLLANITTALMPWNPLVYTVRKNIYCYAEMACDDWAVVCGTHPEEFAQELGTLVNPDASPFPALLSVASGFKELSQRLIRLKTGATASPHLQKTWVIIWTIASSCLMAMAFLQPGAKPLNAKELEPTKTKDLTLLPPEKKSPDTIPSFQATVIRATVGGKPSPDTKVWVEILDQDQFVFVGPALTDQEGIARFQVYSAKIQSVLALDQKGFQAWKTLAPGPKSADDLQVNLEPQSKTKIKLLKEGKPLPGTKVELAGFDPHRLFEGYQQIPVGFPKPSGISDENGLVELEPVFANSQIGVRVVDGLNQCFQIHTNPKSVSTISLDKPGALEIHFKGEGPIPTLGQLNWEIFGINHEKNLQGIPILDHKAGTSNSNVTGNQITNLVPGSYSLSFLNLTNTPYVLENKSEIVIKPGKVTHIDIEYSKAASLRGRVVDAKTRKGIPGLFLAVQTFKDNQADPIKQELIRSDSDGNYKCYVRGGGKYNMCLLNHLHDSERYQLPNTQKPQDEQKPWIQLLEGEEKILPEIVLTPSTKIHANIQNFENLAAKETLQVYCPVLPSRNLDSMANFKVFGSQLEIVGFPPEIPLKIRVRQGKLVNLPILRSPDQWAQKPEIEIKEENGVQLSGAIQNQQGAPIPNAKISLFWFFPVPSKSGSIFSQRLMETVNTAEDGSFQFSGYWAGERYYIGVESLGFLPVIDNLNPRLSGVPGTTLDFGIKKLTPIPNKQKQGN